MKWEKYKGEADELLRRIFVENPGIRDEEIVKKLKEAYPQEEITAYAVQHRRHLLGLYNHPKRFPSPQITSLGQTVLSWLEKEKLTIGEISRRLDKSKETVIKILDDLQRKGYDVEVDETSHQAILHKERSLTFKPLEIESVYRSRVRIGIISDTHLCSKYQQLSLLHKAMRELDKEKVDFIVHAGDVVEGRNVYRGQSEEVFFSGYDEQRDYLVENFPRSKRGVKIYMISGQHDYSFYKLSGANILRSACYKRKDLVYRGDFSAKFTVKGVRVEVLHPGGGVSYAKCFDEKTEILTLDGFKKFKDLSDSDKVATLNPETHCIEFQKPTERQRYFWDGPMYHFRAWSVDLLVTPEHRMFVRIYPHRRAKVIHHPEKSHLRYPRDWFFLTAKEIANSFYRQKFQLTSTGRWEGIERDTFEIPFVVERKFGNGMKHFGRVKMDDWLEFLGWYIAEGSCRKNGITISQVRDCEKREQIFDVCKRLGFGPRIFARGVYVCSRELCEYLRNNVGASSDSKRIPREFKQLCPRQLRILLSSLFAGDGVVDGRGRWTFFGTKSRRLVDDVQECLTKVGLRGTVSRRGGMYRLSVSQEYLYPTINRPPAVVHYRGYVYDVTVPNHIILVRRNGRVIWSGNSYKVQRITENLVASVIERLREDPNTLPHVLIFGHWHTPLYMPYMGIHCVMAPCFQTQTPYLRQKGLHPVIGYWVLEIKFDDKGVVASILPKFRNLSHLTVENDY